jgi:hypothetical protein
MSTPDSKCVRRGYSRETDPVRAVRELIDGIRQTDPALVVFFCSTEFDLAGVEREIGALVNGVPVVGCTSAGEITPAGYLTGSIVGFSLAGPDFAAVAAPVRRLSRFSIADGQDIVGQLRRRLEEQAGPVSGDNTFAFLLVDGGCKCEEIFLSSIHPALRGIPLFGGSSGSDLGSGRPRVFFDGQFHADAAVLVLVRTERPFTLFTTSHFVHSETKMVITEADPVNRIVSEINAEPAAAEYARIVGLDAGSLSPMMFATHPVMVKIGGRYYARSIQKVNDDGSLTFFCAIDKGIVLTVAQGREILEDLDSLFTRLCGEVGALQLVIGADCVLRNLELDQKQLKQQAGSLLARHNVIGFSSFGEQFQAMHVNQTFTGAAIGFPPQVSAHGGVG